MTDGIAVDTSVAVPLLVASHPEHDAVVAWADGRTLRLTGHSLAETFAVLTRLPGDALVAPADAVTLMDSNFADTVVASKEGVAGVHRLFARSGVAGGATYDGLVALAARENGVALATRDARARSTYEALGVRVVLVSPRA